MCFNLTELPSIPVSLNQLFKRICKTRILVAKSLRFGQSPEKTLLGLLKIALSQSIISGIKKFPPLLIHWSAPHDEI